MFSNKFSLTEGDPDPIRILELGQNVQIKQQATKLSFSLDFFYSKLIQNLIWISHNSYSPVRAGKHFGSQNIKHASKCLEQLYPNLERIIPAFRNIEIYYNFRFHATNDSATKIRAPRGEP